MLEERLLGGGGGGARAGDVPAAESGCEYDHSFLALEEERERGRQQAWRGRKSARERVLDCLATLQCGDAEVVDSALGIFRRIYTLRRRRRRADFVGSRVRERAALAFSVCNALTRAGVPRPPEDIAAVMGLESRRPMLDIARCLGFTEEDRSELSAWQECTELLDPEPADYTDIVCAKLDIPFHVAGQIREEVPRILAQLYGRHPLVVLAVAIKCVLEARSGGLGLGREQERRLCEVARCQPRTLKAAVEELRRTQANF